MSGIWCESAMSAGTHRPGRMYRVLINEGEMHSWSSIEWEAWREAWATIERLVTPEPKES